jgi:hypothetical protein
MTTKTAVNLVSGLVAMTLIAVSPAAAGQKNKGGKHGEPGIEARVAFDAFILQCPLHLSGPTRLLWNGRVPGGTVPIKN